jgi:hypothetical protein
MSSKKTKNIRTGILIETNNKYNPVFDDQAYRLCLLGLNNNEIATFFSVELIDITTWVMNYPSFGDAINRGRTIADANVVESFYKRATGYIADRVKITYDKESGQHIEHHYQELVQGDVKAQIEWLSRRQREKWRAANITILPAIQEPYDSDKEEKIPDNQIDLSKWYKDFSGGSK